MKRQYDIGFMMDAAKPVEEQGYVPRACLHQTEALVYIAIRFFP